MGRKRMAGSYGWIIRCMQPCKSVPRRAICKVCYGGDGGEGVRGWVVRGARGRVDAAAGDLRGGFEQP